MIDQTTEERITARAARVAREEEQTGAAKFTGPGRGAATASGTFTQPVADKPRRPARYHGPNVRGFTFGWLMRTTTRTTQERGWIDSATGAVYRRGATIYLQETDPCS